MASILFEIFKPSHNIMSPSGPKMMEIMSLPDSRCLATLSVLVAIVVLLKHSKILGKAYNL